MTKEFLQMIKLDHEEIVGTMQYAGTKIRIHNPLKLFEFDNQILFAPWVPFNCSKVVEIEVSKLVFGPCDIIDELKDLYEKFREYFSVNPDMHYGQYMCKESLKNITEVTEAYKKKLQQDKDGVNDDKPQTPAYPADNVTPEDLDRMMEEVFDTPSKDKLN